MSSRLMCRDAQQTLPIGFQGRVFLLWWFLSMQNYQNWIIMKFWRENSYDIFLLLHNGWKWLKMSQFWHLPSIFVLLKVTCLATLFDRKFQIFIKSPKLTILGIFNFVHSQCKKSRSHFNLTNFWTEKFGMIFT